MPHSTQAVTIAIANPPKSVTRAGRRIRGRRRTSATQMAASGANSGPTTMAPMIRMGWSR